MIEDSLKLSMNQIELEARSSPRDDLALTPALHGEEGVLRNVFSFVKDRFAGKIGSQVVNQPAPLFEIDRLR